MAWTKPTTTEFKAYFTRDFNYAPSGSPDDLDFVTDGDITKAMGQASVNFPTNLFKSNEDTTIAYMWLAAFYLVYDIQMSSQGLGSRSNFPISSQQVGGVSVTFSIPERYLKDPQVAIYTQNGYGMKYLGMALPHLVGHVTVVNGQTTVG